MQRFLLRFRKRFFSLFHFNNFLTQIFIFILGIDQVRSIFCQAFFHAGNFPFMNGG